MNRTVYLLRELVCLSLVIIGVSGVLFKTLPSIFRSVWEASHQVDWLLFALLCAALLITSLAFLVYQRELSLPQ